MDYLRHQKYKSKHTTMEYLNNIQKNRILEVKEHSLFNTSVEKMDKMKQLKTEQSKI